MKKLAFVIPWYGANISGGAEMECRELAIHLQKAGIPVEILTTCVKDFNSDWNVNYYKEGIETVNSILVRRFKVKKRDVQAFDEVNYKLIHNKPVNLEEEDCFFYNMVNSDELVEYIKVNGELYQSFIFIPYMFGTTYYGSKACPSNAAIIPCVHNESYAYMTRMKEMFKGFKKVIFNAEAESKLAYELYDLKATQTITLGLGIDTNIAHSPKRFREKYNLFTPFILYAGRKDKGKNVDELIKYFEILCKEQEDIDLVLIGGGTIDIPQSIKDRVHDLGFVDIQDKYDAYAAAMCLCQPSKNESFSIVIMESWIAGRPVLVHEDCDVTADFTKLSNGGLYFNKYNDFKECILLYYYNSILADKMGQLGRKFVKQHYDWDIVVEKYKKFLYEKS